METSNGLEIDKRGEVQAERISDGEEVRLAWGKIDDPDAGDYQDTLGVEDGEWVRNDTDEDGTFFVYEVDGEEYKIYKEDLNQRD